MQARKKMLQIQSKAKQTGQPNEDNQHFQILYHICNKIPRYILGVEWKPWIWKLFELKSAICQWIFNLPHGNNQNECVIFRFSREIVEITDDCIWPDQKHWSSFCSDKAYECAPPLQFLISFRVNHFQCLILNSFAKLWIDCKLYLELT